MAAVRSLFGRFFGNAVSTSAGVGIGGAVQNTLNPLTQELANETWALHPVMPPDPYALANGVAQGQVDETVARSWAAESGIGDQQFTALVNIANSGPGVAEAFELWRRGKITEPGFRRAARRHAIEQEWIDALVAVKDRLLTPAEIATAVQQGHLPEDGLLPPPVGGSPPFSIPLTQIPIDPSTEAAGSGVTRARLEVMANLAGLPPGDIELLQMWNRGIVDEASVEAGIREGHRKTKWIPAVKELRWAILSPIQYVEARLRGWITDPEMYAGALKSGMRQTEVDLLFKTHGRPLSWHQVWIGLQRGGVYDGPTAGIAAPFLKALQESNIRPEWYNLAWAQRYSYPSAFVLRSLVQTHVLTQAQGEADLIDMGWRPDRAKQVSTAWSAGTTSTVDPLVRSARTALVTALRRSFVLGDSDEAAARSILAAEQIDATTADELLATWTRERSITRNELTPTQLKKALQHGVVNPATGAPITRDEVIVELEARGYTSDDAQVFLDT